MTRLQTRQTRPPPMMLRPPLRLQRPRNAEGADVAPCGLAAAEARAGLNLVSVTGAFGSEVSDDLQMYPDAPEALTVASTS
jgi:hypothetical protein